MSCRGPDLSPPRRHVRSPARLGAVVVTIALAATACGLGQRPTIDATPTAVGTMTGKAAIDDVLTHLDAVAAADFTADYTAVLAYGTVASAVIVTQDASTTPPRRSVTIGDVRYIETVDTTSTCSVPDAGCSDGIDPAKVSDTGVTPDFAFGDMAKRLRRDAQALVGTPVASTPTLAGVAATCVDLPVTGGTKHYCVFDDGVLARYAGGDLTIDVDNYRTTVDESLFVV